MDDEREFGSDTFRNGGVFDDVITSLESRTERWRQLWLLALGLASIWLGHEISTWADDPSEAGVRLWTTVVVLFGLVQIGRAVSQFVNSVSSRQARVFAWRHLAACGTTMLTVVVALVSMLLIRGPLGSLLSHGTLTGKDIADIGFVIAAGLCLVGAITAFIAAAVEFREEHNWRHPKLRS